MTGREVIRRTREYIENDQSFGIETTLSESGYLETMRVARAHGFVVRLIYICLGNPREERSTGESALRTGGHDVPDEDIRRRYERSLSNLPVPLRLVNEAWLFDNGGDEPQIMLETREGVVTWRAEHEPEWVTRVRETMSPSASLRESK